jgi:hypothetical protein
MSKRTKKFKRIARDYYPTPPKAVEPLVRHLPEVFTFWEPCAGDGRLIHHIQEARPRAECVLATDIHPLNSNIVAADALDLFPPAPDLIITNPPWSRIMLHPLIDHLAGIAPTWLLFDADWAYTKQSLYFMQFLKVIQVVGRVKWIEGSKTSGLDNAAWYLFDKKDMCDLPRETKFYA